MFRLLKNSIDIAPQQMFCFRPESNYASTHESKELIRENEMDLDLDRPSYPSRRVSSWIFFLIQTSSNWLKTYFQDIAKSVSSAYLQLNSARRPSDKKLSVVPEQDEQLTVQSTVQNVRPTILRAPSCEAKPKEAGEIV